MGIRDWFGLGQENGDLSLIEVSNDSGDHILIEVPTGKTWETVRALRKAGVTRDDDDVLMNRIDAQKRVDERDSSKHRYHSARIVDEREDYEDSHDAEAEPLWGGFW